MVGYTERESVTSPEINLFADVPRLAAFIRRPLSVLNTEQPLRMEGLMLNCWNLNSARDVPENRFFVAHVPRGTFWEYLVADMRAAEDGCMDRDCFQWVHEGIMCPTNIWPEGLSWLRRVVCCGGHEEMDGLLSVYLDRRFCLHAARKHCPLIGIWGRVIWLTQKHCVAFHSLAADSVTPSPSSSPSPPAALVGLHAASEYINNLMAFGHLYLALCCFWRKSESQYRDRRDYY